MAEALDCKAESRRFVRLLEGLDETIRMLERQVVMLQNQYLAAAARADHAEKMVELLQNRLQQAGGQKESKNV